MNPSHDRILRTLLLAGLSTASAALAQEVEDDGAILAPSIACTLEDGTHLGGTSVDARYLFTKKSGFVPVVLAKAPGTTGVPDFRFEEMLKDRSTGLLPEIHVDALSIGLDAVHVETSTGVPKLYAPAGSHSWIGLMFSIEDGTTGGTAEGVIKWEDESSADGSGADLFDYTFEQGPLPDDYTDHSMRDHDSGEIGLYDAAASVKGELVSVDLHLPAYELEGISDELSGQPTVFFSVTDGSKSAVPPSWWGSTAASGATVFATTWDDSTSSWSEPRPAAAYDELGLDVTDDVDALAIQYHLDSSGAVANFEIVFSTSVLGTVATHELMYIDMLAPEGMPAGPAALEGNGGPVVIKLKKGKGNVDAVCVYDPSLGQSGCSASVIWAFVFGAPYALDVTGVAFPDPPVERRLYSSLFRGRSPGPRGIESHMVGWTASGRNPGTAYHLFAIGGESGPSTTWFINAVVPRTRTTRFGGGAVSANVPLPAFLTGPVRARCLFLWSVWIAATPAEFAQSYPVRIQI